MTLTGLHWRRIRLFTVLGIMVSLSLGLILHALKTNINAYVTPTGLLQSEHIEAPKRLGGLVESMSVVYDQYHKVHFAVSDGNQQVNVVFDGVLPALFEEVKGWWLKVTTTQRMKCLWLSKFWPNTMKTISRHCQHDR